MGKRVAIFLVVLLITALAILVYFFQQGRKTLYTDPYKAISSGAAVVIETVDLQSFMNSLTTGKGIFGEAGKIKEFDSFNMKLKYVTDQLNTAGIKKLNNDGSAIISFHPTPEGELKPLLSMTVPGDLRYRQIKGLLQSSGIKEVIESNLKAKPVLKLPYNVKNRKDTVYISLVSGLLLCSSSDDLLQDAMDQIPRENDIRNAPGFSRVLLASGKNEDKIFIVFSNLRKIFKSFLNNIPNKVDAHFARLAGTAGGDIYLNDGSIALSGYTESTDSTDILYKYKSMQSQVFNTFKILPSATALFETCILLPEEAVVKTDGTVVNRTIDLARNLKQYTGKEITRCYIDIKNRPVEDNTLIIYELNNRVQAEEIFLNETGNEKEILSFEPDDQVKIPIYKVDLKGLAEVMLPGFADNFNESYFVFYDNFLISGNSYVTLSRLIYDNLLNKTLANDLNYRDFESTLPSRAAYSFYCIPSKLINLLAGYLNEDIIKALFSNKSSLDKIQAIGYQFAASNNMLYNSLSVMFKEGIRKESTTEWETLLDTTAGIKPFFFTNHITSAKEIFVQDIKNNTYLINAAGRVLWKVPLREKITGTVYMIDYYRNGKYQLLFSGKNYLHLLDRNGNYVERYPVKLRSPATNSLALIDYDNNMNYRLFIAGEDKLIYSYDKTGNVVKGWKPFRTNSYVRNEINYFKVSGKDYLVASDESSIYFLDRTGNKRINLKEPVTRAAGSTMRLTPGSESYVVCSSPEGTVQNIYFDGSVKKFSLNKFSVDHTFDIFDIDADGFGEYIFIDKGILYLYDHNKSALYTKQFDTGNLGGPISFIFSASDRKIGVSDVDKEQIFLIDKDGDIMKGFPLRGASMFSIGKLSDKSSWHLIVGGTDRFLYNYKIDTD